MRSRALRNERQRDLERGRLSTYRVSRVQGVWASARPAASDASSVRSMRLVLLGGSPRRWANTLAPSAESRRAFGTGPDDCVSSAAGVSSSSTETPAQSRAAAALRPASRIRRRSDSSGRMVGRGSRRSPETAAFVAEQRSRPALLLVVSLGSERRMERGRRKAAPFVETGGEPVLRAGDGGSGPRGGGRVALCAGLDMPR
jgi:hypothetical protein